MNKTNKKVYQPTGLVERKIQPGERVYTVAAVAQLFEVKPFTVRDWIKKGYLQAFKLPGNAQTAGVRITHEAVNELANRKHGE